MRDGKKIIFTKHALQRAKERFNIEDQDILIERFKNALKLDYTLWVDYYIDEAGIKYVVSEHKNDFTIVTLYPFEI